MANTDDLDEYDAGLELRLKKEYADVFQIFRFCVVTDEATYLCNELDIDCVPHAAYLLFELSMVDVWVWDRNRPTRIIPRAHVFTTGDVTVEQLRGDDGELEKSLPKDVLAQLRTQLAVEAGAAEDDESSEGESTGEPADAESGRDASDDTAGTPPEN
ncbi:MAG: Protein often found in Actinomycetes clustered with signal peptidase and/or RNaseHII [Thermoleophilia bacterium]|jgi:hypothetical protein|nr:Protein often found in Actinomycetes clustered with signal peptidase and/or RNaseHII [Thermoleophilia bacterium]